MQDSTNETQSSGNKKRTLQESVDTVENSQSEYQKFE